jgi:two-component system OmpR family response regulator
MIDDAPLVVVAEQDGWVLRLLHEGLRDEGFTVVAVDTAEAALARTCELPPDCIVCAAALADHDGYWLAHELRSQPSPVSEIPLLILGDEKDEHARMLAFEAGADAYTTKPFRIDELVAQLNALVVMARRMKGERTVLSDSLGPPSSLEPASFQGDIEHMSLPSLLAILEIERRTGKIDVRSDEHQVTLELHSGFIVDATLDGQARDPVEVLRPAIAWTSGPVTFHAAPSQPPPTGARPVRALIGAARPSGMMAAVKAPAPIRAPTTPHAAPSPPGQRKPMPALGEQPTRRMEDEGPKPKPKGK